MAGRGGLGLRHRVGKWRLPKEGLRMNRVSRKYAEGESPRERIVNAARRLFGSKGFYATTTAELAVEAAVSIGQIYRLFTGKDDIILAIVEENVRVRVAGMSSIFPWSETLAKPE